MYIFDALEYEELLNIISASKAVFNMALLTIQRRLVATRGYPRACGKCHIHKIQVPDEYLTKIGFVDLDKEIELLKLYPKSIIKGDLIFFTWENGDRTQVHDSRSYTKPSTYLKDFDLVNTTLSLPSLSQNKVPKSYWYVKNKKIPSHYFSEREIIPVGVPIEEFLSTFPEIDDDDYFNIVKDRKFREKLIQNVDYTHEERYGYTLYSVVNECVFTFENFNDFEEGLSLEDRITEYKLIINDVGTIFDISIGPNPAPDNVLVMESYSCMEYEPDYS